MDKKNLEEKFRRAHLEDEDLEELVEISDDLSIDNTLHLLLDSELLAEEETTYYRLNQELAGDVTLGVEPRSKSRVNLNQDQLAHSLILGKTQYGKSTLLALLTTQFLEKGVSYWSFEPKQDQRHLIRDYPELEVVRLDEIKINPFKPPLPTVPIRRWFQVVWEVLTQEEDLLSGSKSMGYELLEKLLEESELREDDPSLQSAQPEDIPTVREFADLIETFLMTKEQRSGPRRRYLERLKTRISSLLFSFQETLDCHTGWPISQLAGKPIVFEYESIDQSAARFLILTLLYKLFYYYQGKGKRTKDEFHYLIFDEGEKIFSPYLEGTATGNPFLNELVNWAKEFGLGFILANQTPKLTSSIKDNATTRVVFNIDGSYIDEVGSRLGLDAEQKRHLRELDVGSAVVKTSGKFTKPFLVGVPHFELEKDVTDKEARKHSKQFNEELNSRVVPIKREEESEKSEEGEEEEETLDIEYQMLLGNIAEFPFVNLTGRQEKLGWGSNKLNRVTEDLRNKGLIRKRKLNKGGRGGSIALLELTNQALRYLKEQDIKPKQSNGRGGIVHTYWVSQLTNYYKERGYDVRTEVELNNVIADIVVTDQSGEVVALEVEVTKPKDTLAKLDELLSAVDKVLIVADKRTILNEVEEEIDLEERENLELKKAQNMDL